VSERVRDSSSVLIGFVLTVVCVRCGHSSFVESRSWGRGAVRVFW